MNSIPPSSIHHSSFIIHPSLRLISLFTGLAFFLTLASLFGAPPASAPAIRPSTAPTSIPATSPTNFGPDTVILKELVNLYDPVPFDHKTHAKMAEMWDGCTTCHHRTPQAATQPSTTSTSTRTTTGAATSLATSNPQTRIPNPQSVPIQNSSFIIQQSSTTQRSQNESAAVPACIHCHPAAEAKAEIHLPSLKGAYHRQCLNCHREWSGANDCVICHRPRDAATAAAAGVKVQSPTTTPTRDDIVGRMHPPLTAPDEKPYKTRFTPADGNNVLFRHAEHVKSYGLKCVSCHRHDNCSHCHDPKAKEPATRMTPKLMLHPAETWKESHGPCIACHTQTRCKSCHYKDDQSAPPRFDHQSTGQAFDTDHSKLSCTQCHTTLRSRDKLDCGGAPCHPKNPSIAFPLKRPGPVVATQPTSQPSDIPHGPLKGVVR